jgi:hypothetical protein
MRTISPPTAVLVFFILLFGVFAGHRECQAAMTLTLTPATITFPDQDPDLFPSTTATSTVAVSVTTSAMGNQNFHLSALSRGNLTSGSASIPISNISWTAVKTGGDNRVTYFSGTMTTAVPGTTVMTGRGNDTNPGLGTLTFSILNQWGYATGNYSQITDFTLSAP